MNIGIFAVWLLVASWFLAAIIWFAVSEIKENKRRKKAEQKKKSTEETAKKNGIEVRDIK